MDDGWRVDALLGETTREHSDLDLVVLLPGIDAVRSALAEAGYGVELRLLCERFGLACQA